MSHGVSLLLISAAAGYWVLAQSEKEKGRVKKMGQLLGLAIIAVRVAGTVCKIYYLSTSGKGAFCPPSPLCPFTGKSSAPAMPPASQK